MLEKIKVKLRHWIIGNDSQEDKSWIKYFSEKKESRFSTDLALMTKEAINSRLIEALDKYNTKSLKDHVIDTKVFNPFIRKGYAQDSTLQDVKRTFSTFHNPFIASGQFLWYANQSFIGYQACSILSQNWLINKALTMPAKDAIRNGYEVTVNSGETVNEDVLDEIKRLDHLYDISKQVTDFVRNSRKFGVRIAMFRVESNDEDYYEKPFNPDGILPNSYKGITQIDPFWIWPELDSEDATNPSSPNFQIPTWWQTTSGRIHRSHLIISIPDPVDSILKPAYIYGGISTTQKIFQRIYAAERTADEAPQLAMTKRTNALHVNDVEASILDENRLKRKMDFFAYFRDNFGVKILGKDEKYEQFDTSLADLDTTIMTQFQLVSAASDVPAVKLMGTPPKGFNSTGEHEESSYHEALESIQSYDIRPLLERHHLLLIRSEICPKFGIEPFGTSVVFNPLDSTTKKGKAENNKLKAETGAFLVSSGAVLPTEERQRIINDRDSDYSWLSDSEDDDLLGEESPFEGEGVGELEHYTQKPMTMLSKGSPLKKESEKSVKETNSNAQEEK